MHTGVERRGVVVWFGQYTEIAFLVSLFGFTQPIYLAASADRSLRTLVLASFSAMACLMKSMPTLDC